MYRLNRGEKFARLTADSPDPASKPSEPKWFWICECGNRKSIRMIRVVRGYVRSCGCLRKETTGARARTHGASKTAEFKIWAGIRKRCYQSASTTYARYGGRGIVMCERWQSFENFSADMGLRPSKKHSIERIYNDGAYSPENCRWATPEEQARNKSNNHLLTFRGEIKTLSEWARIVRLDRLCILQRLTRLGWDVDKALTTPSQNGPQSIRQLAKKHGLKRTTVSARLHKGWSLQRALNTPV